MIDRLLARLGIVTHRYLFRAIKNCHSSHHRVRIELSVREIEINEHFESIENRLQAAQSTIMRMALELTRLDEMGATNATRRPS
jgi:hypothetical protein